MFSSIEFLSQDGPVLFGLRAIVSFFLSFACFRIASISGYYQEQRTHGDEKRDLQRWTPEQQKLAKQFIDEYLTPRLGKGLEEYQGRLPGTGGPSTLQAKAFAALEDVDMGTPEDWTNRVNTYLESRRKYLAPTYEKQDALLKEKMASMGLQHSTDVLKAQSDVLGTRAAEESMIGAEKYDQYEQMGLTVYPQMLASIGTMQKEIEDAGDVARFQEWLRTQPEYSPVIDQIMSILGMQPVEKGDIQTRGFTQEWGASGSYTSDKRTKKNLIDLTPFAPIYAQGLRRLTKLTPFAFQYKQEIISDGDQVHVGVVADQLKMIVPELVHTVTINGEEYLAVDYAGLAVRLLLELKARSMKDA